MHTLFTNAVQSIQLGIEDYEANDPRRALSAVRNFYSGVLLLAKEVLARTAPNADPKELLSERYKPVSDGSGGVTYVSASERTIDFTSIGERFRDFGLTINQAALKDLNRIRKDVEHYFTRQRKEALREAIAKAFPVVLDLFRLAGEEPRRVLGPAWQTMLDVHEVYEKELQLCRASFANMEWRSSALAASPFNCPQCESDLVAQEDAANVDPQLAISECRLCGAEISAEDAIVHALAKQFAKEVYDAHRESGEPPVGGCPECGVRAYIFGGEENRCAWCSFELEDNCASCSVPLTPNDAGSDDNRLCSYCDYKLSKDD